MHSADNAIVYSVENLADVAAEVLKRINGAYIVTLSGDLGAGKTTLVSAMLKAAGIDEAITSPTFSYVHVYEDKDEKKFFHFDLYRISTLDDFIFAGFEEYLYTPKSLALIEWPEIIMPLLTRDVYHITIDFHEDPNKRILSLVQE